MKKFVALLLTMVMAFCLVACSDSEPKEQTGADRESDVTIVVKESLAKSFGIEYSDFKISHTSCSYVTENKTSDDQTSWYYLFKSAFNDKNKNNHEVTARAYLVKEENKIYITYITLDGEKVFFDEETEDRMLNIGK